MKAGEHAARVRRQVWKPRNYFEAAKPDVSISGAQRLPMGRGSFPKTGEDVQDLRATLRAKDCGGTVINPTRGGGGRSQGGVRAGGLSNAMFEEFLFDEHGQQLTTTLESYRLANRPGRSSRRGPPHSFTAHGPHTPPSVRVGLARGIPGPRGPGRLDKCACGDALRAVRHRKSTELPIRSDKAFGQLPAPLRKASTAGGRLERA